MPRRGSADAAGGRVANKYARVNEWIARPGITQLAPSDGTIEGSTKFAARSAAFSAAVQFMQPNGHSGGATNDDTALTTSYMAPFDTVSKAACSSIIRNKQRRSGTRLSRLKQRHPRSIINSKSFPS